MASTKRMLISMSPELHQILFDYAEAAGQPASRCVVDLMEELKPQLIKSTEVMRLARQGRVADATGALHELSESLIQQAHIANDACSQLELPYKRRDD